MSKISRRELIAAGTAIGLAAVAKASPFSGPTTPGSAPKEKVIDLYKKANADADWTQRYDNYVKSLIETHGRDLSKEQVAMLRRGNCFEVRDMMQKEGAR
jgi:hypothetical protein